jgi:PAS domain-containing protein
MISTLTAIALVGTAFAIALAALVAFSLFDRRQSANLRRLARAEHSKVVFLFDGERLVDASPMGWQLMDTASGSTLKPSWSALSALLRPRFDDFAELEISLAENGEMNMTSNDGLTRLRAEWIDGTARIQLVTDDSAAEENWFDRHAHDAMRKELTILRDMASHVPYLTWRENARGEIVWANQAYLDIADAANADAAVQPWPPARLFDDKDLNDTEFATGPKRARLDLGDDSYDHWFDIHRSLSGTEVQFSALAADDTVRAEKSLSEFFTTLTQTFAHLPIGLAIFDGSRKLSMFNPALTDLTMLPVEFLCAQPTLFSFLDSLRDKRMMPEPKNYKTWRQRMADLEESATSGSYCETWHLPTGQTYRVTGRPHPGGAIAFLFEDISSEISLTRRFRSELDMGQAALDAMPDAVAVFNQAGILSLSNTAYTELWGNDPGTSLADISIVEAIETWHCRCNPTPVWRQLRAFVREQGDRNTWEAPVALKDGRSLHCRFRPLPKGGTLVSFDISNDLMGDFLGTRTPAYATAKN